MQDNATVKLNLNIRTRAAWFPGSPGVCFVSEAWLQGEKDILKYRVHFSPPFRMFGECADSVAFLPDWVAKQTRCPESGRRVLCKWRGKSLIIGNTWFANHNISELEQIWKTSECPSWGDEPELLFSSEQLGNLPKDIWDENMALWTQRECSLLCVSLCIMQRHNRVGPATHAMRTWASEWTTPSSMCLPEKWR